MPEAGKSYGKKKHRFDDATRPKGHGSAHTAEGVIPEPVPANDSHVSRDE